MNKRLMERVITNFSMFPPEPFTYNSDSRQFTVGGQTVTLPDYVNYLSPPKDEITIEQACSLIEDNALLLNAFDNHFQMPRMTEWIKAQTNSRWKSTQDNVTETMIDAYAEVSGFDRKHLLKNTFMGFGLVLYRPGHPVFNVVGNCACYGVEPQGYLLDDHFWNAGFAEYGSHNIDNDFQLVALHAGAGALAELCLTETR